MTAAEQTAWIRGMRYGVGMAADVVDQWTHMAECPAYPSSDERASICDCQLGEVAAVLGGEDGLHDTAEAKLARVEALADDMAARGEASLTDDTDYSDGYAHGQIDAVRALRAVLGGPEAVTQP